MPSPQATKASSVRTLGFAGLAHRPGPAARSHDAEESLAASADGGIWLAFAGRLDNRSEIWRALPEPAGPLAALRDAELVLEAYRSWGTGCFERLLGPFAVALLDLPARQALLARDPTGARGLAYFLDEHRLVAASEDAAVAAGPAVGRELDEIRLAMYFGLTELVLGHSVFAKVKQLRPGHWLRVSPTQVEESCFYRPRFDDALLQANDDELAEELLYRLRLAVECRVGEPERTGVLMSGGLDSVPLAALAAERMPRGRALAAFSWVFDRHRRADERRHIEQAVEHLGLSPCYLHGDDALPLTPLSGWPTHPGTYEQNAYRLLHERAYRAAAEQGVTVLLTGMCGDQLYSGGSSWLAELVAQG
nr:asparagine synthase-related protein [Thermoanaerobaculia bacterium]